MLFSVSTTLGPSTNLGPLMERSVLIAECMSDLAVPRELVRIVAEYCRGGGDWDSLKRALSGMVHLWPWTPWAPRSWMALRRAAWNQIGVVPPTRGIKRVGVRLFSSRCMSLKCTVVYFDDAAVWVREGRRSFRTADWHIVEHITRVPRADEWAPCVHPRDFCCCETHYVGPFSATYGIEWLDLP